ncbi:unnamed protein product [marine sediment metagenome]|uniref:Large polyvalent protein associated domain-containing protein n=1 Tax=marine sediment metagenome TaxID=412755 RepID=X0TFX1_9ZZZZ
MVPNELRPGWMLEQQSIQFGGDRENGLVFLPQSWFPFDETYNALGMVVEPEEAIRRGLLSEAHPLIKAGVEAGTGQSIFRGDPLQRVQDVGLKAIPQAIMGQSGTALDSAIGMRPAREALPGGSIAKMPTLGRKITRGLIGGAVQPVNYQRGLRGRYYELDALQRKLRDQYNEAMSVGDEARAENLMKQWVATMRQMWRYKLPVAREMEQTFQRLGTPSPGPP